MVTSDGGRILVKDRDGRLLCEMNPILDADVKSDLAKRISLALESLDGLPDASLDQLAEAVQYRRTGCLVKANCRALEAIAAVDVEPEAIGGG